MKLANFIDTSHARVMTLFKSYLTNSPAQTLLDAIEHSVLNGGKRIRPLLVYLTGHAFNVSWENLDAAACAIELIHTYSLIHDDLPAMDNSDLRRGKPACHKAFDEATAILAGDALQPLAFEIIASHPSGLDAQQRLAMIRVLSHASGMHGMVAGQALDLAGMNSPDSLLQMYRLKTGALLTASVKLAAIAANADYTSVEKFADCLGLAFQMQDDLLDIEGNTETIGKPQGTDAANHKATYITLTDITRARQKIQELFSAALDAIEFQGDKGALFHEFAHALLQRKK